MMWGRLRALRQRKQIDEELREELAAHMALKRRRLESEGHTPEEATRQARMALGSAAAWQENTRAIWTFTALEDLLRDVRFGLRLLGRDKTFTTVALVTLALGIGANTAVFTLLDGLLLRPLPVERPEELVRLAATNLPPGDRTWVNGREVRETERRNLPYPLFEVLSKKQQVFSDMFGVTGTGPLVMDREGIASQVAGSRVTGSFFQVLGVEPVIGRMFTVADDVRGGPAEGWPAVISYDLWQRLFAGSAQTIGARISLERVPFTVVGVAPQGFRGVQPGVAVDVWMPISSMEAMYPDFAWRTNRGLWMLTVSGRLRPGVTIEKASAHLGAISRGALEEAQPLDAPAEERQHFTAIQLGVRGAASGESAMARQYGPALWFLLAAVTAVLLIAATNVANLLLARASARRHEIVTRLAIGASPGRIRRQLLVESALLAAGGVLSGLLLGRWLTAALLAALAGPDRPLPLDVPLDWRVAAFLSAVLAAVVLAAGWAPAWISSRASAHEILKQRTAEMAGVRLRGALAVVQLALSFLLLGGAGLMIGSLRSMLGEETGYAAGQTALLLPDLFNAGIEREDQGRAYRNLLGGVRQLPGVAAAAWTLIPPLTGGLRMSSIEAPGAMHLSARERAAFFHEVSDGYFSAMGIALREGGDLPESAARRDACVISENLARRFFGSAAASIGQAITISSNRKVLRVNGVVADAKYNNIREPSPPTVYVPYGVEGPARPGMTLAVRYTGAASAVLPAVQRLFQQEAGRMPFVRISTIEGNLRQSVRTEQLIAALLASFGVFALLIAATGVGGLLSYSVVRRYREIGIRMALGAAPGEVRMRFWIYGLRLAALGIGVGAVMCWPLRRVLDAYLYGVQAANPLIWCAVAAALFLAATIAAAAPAWRASRVDPCDALRVE